MKTQIQLSKFRHLLKEKEEGFSLIELVVVVAVLAILSAISMPSLICVQRKSKASTAIAAMRQIQSECAINKVNTGNSGSFRSSNLNSYQIQSAGSNSCSGASGSGLIIAIPYDTNILPTFLLDTNRNDLTYNFKGLTGRNFPACLSSICLGASAKLSLFNQNFREAIRNGETLEDKFYRRGNTIYAIVGGATWEAAQAKAKSLGGDLATVNDQKENDWLVNELFGNDKASAKLTNKGSAIWLGQRLNNSGSYVSISGDADVYNNWGFGEYADGIGKGEKYTIMNLYNNNSRDPGTISTVANQQYGEAHIFYGLAEIKLNEIDEVNLDDLN